MSVGMGFDAHRLTPDRKLILGGVEIAHPLGLLGHSDADVLTHATSACIFPTTIPLTRMLTAWRFCAGFGSWRRKRGMGW